MRLCRFQHAGTVHAGIYREQNVLPLRSLAEVAGTDPREFESDNLLEYLPPDGPRQADLCKLVRAADTNGSRHAACLLPVADIKLLVPVPRPSKIMLLAGNYAAHIEEGGRIATARDATFPYVFMKPPTTTLNHPNDPVTIPAVSPNAIDWECELAVVIGRRCRQVSEADALQHVAGYTIVNDISDRKFRPNPNRTVREQDKFFDWLHGKWHDSFCPMGPCITSAAAIADPQALSLELRLNGAVRQRASTGQMVFPVAAVIEFISNIVTLEPGDIISTGTPAGVGNTTGTYLRHGDVLEAQISAIGVLRSPIQSA